MLMSAAQGLAMLAGGAEEEKIMDIDDSKIVEMIRADFDFVEGSEKDIPKEHFLLWIREKVPKNLSVNQAIDMLKGVQHESKEIEAAGPEGAEIEKELLTNESANEIQPSEERSETKEIVNENEGTEEIQPMEAKECVEEGELQPVEAEEHADESHPVEEKVFFEENQSATDNGNAEKEGEPVEDSQPVEEKEFFEENQSTTDNDNAEKEEEPVEQNQTAEEKEFFEKNQSSTDNGNAEKEEEPVEQNQTVEVGELVQQEEDSEENLPTKGSEEPKEQLEQFEGGDKIDAEGEHVGAKQLSIDAVETESGE